MSKFDKAAEVTQFEIASKILLEHARQQYEVVTELEPALAILSTSDNTEMGDEIVIEGKLIPIGNLMTAEHRALDTLPKLMADIARREGVYVVGALCEAWVTEIKQGEESLPRPERKEIVLMIFRSGDKKAVLRCDMTRSNGKVFLTPGQIEIESPDNMMSGRMIDAPTTIH